MLKLAYQHNKTAHEIEDKKETRNLNSLLTSYTFDYHIRIENYRYATLKQFNVYEAYPVTDTKMFILVNIKMNR